MQTFLEVSVGEGLDKLTILDIKLEKIKNEQKRLDCKKEFDTIYPSLKPAIDKCEHLYKWLKYVNTKIWDLQDEIRENGKHIENGLQKILDFNDMRFRIKKRINSALSSSLNEQKGYADRVGLFISHLGMGDLIHLNGAIRYAALQVDHLFVACTTVSAVNLRQLIGDDTTIEVVEYDNVKHIFPVVGANKIKGMTITHRFISGNWLNYKRPLNTMIPDVFYTDCGFPIDVKNVFFWYKKPSDELQIPDIPYIFTHGSSSTNKKLDFTKNIDVNSIFTIDPEYNYYPVGHVWHSKAELYLNKPILLYGSVIENASEIYVSNSCFQCFACHLNTKATKKEVFDRDTGEISKYFKF